MDLVKSKTSDKVSLYRTEHEFKNFAEPTTIEDVLKLIDWAKKINLKYYFLGNGSNVLFKNRKVKSLIIKNSIPSEIKKIENDKFYISSSTPVAKVMKKMLDEGRDSFFYLASVPATIGGAVSMNAGRGEKHGVSILDFVEEIHYLENVERKKMYKESINSSYRTTPFTGESKKFIYGVVFRFPKINVIGNPILERIEYSKSAQDYGSANCGSVFKKANPKILKIFKKIPLTIMGASWSKKTLNWISNSGKSSKGILWLIQITKLCHIMIGKKAELELIVIE